jgi:WD40 repeat protein
MDATCMIWQILQEYESSANIDPKPLHILYGHTDTVTSVGISNELDMVVSGSVDGTINIHTIRKGHFVKSISFQNEKISKFLNVNLKLSQRQILVYISCLANNLGSTGIKESCNQVHRFYFFFLSKNKLKFENLKLEKYL